MDALERLITRFQRDLYKPEREHLRREELEAMQHYNEIAHELAEKQRALLIVDPGISEAGLIDFIDPEVTE